MPTGSLRTTEASYSLASLIWLGFLALGLLAVLLPVDPASPLSAPDLVSDGYPAELSRQFYGFIKAAILWVPLGALAAIAGYGHQLKGWALLAQSCLVLIGLPMLAEPLVRDVLEVLYIVPGLAIGLWLGNGLGAGRARLLNSLSSSLHGEGILSPGPMKPVASTIRQDALDGNTGQATSNMPGVGRQHHSTTSGQSFGEPGRSVGAPISGDGHDALMRGSRSSGRGLILRRAFALGLLVLAAAGVLDFPRWPLLLGVGLGVYAMALWYWPWSWLVVVPAALPLLDLAPWTGRYFLDEFDLLMLVTVGMLFLLGAGPKRSPSHPGGRLLIGLLWLAVMVSAVLGIWPWPVLDANAFSSFWSSWNALRILKGFLWATIIFLWFRPSPEERQATAQRLAVGMGVGLLGVGLIGAWEHHIFVGFSERLETYRIVSTFSSMHTGGGHIEAYLVAALPFLWLATSRFRHLLLTGPIMVLTAYVMLYTVARGGVLALVVVIAILTVASLRLAQSRQGRRYVAPVAMLAAVGMVLAGGVGVGYFQQRFATTAEDWQTRVDHWGKSLSMMDGSIGAQLFGMGLGSFPRVYQERGPVDKQPASFGFAREQGNTYFRLGTGETVYYAQRIPFTSGMTYRLEVDLRSRQGDARLDTPVCEKLLLNSRQCEWFGFNVPGDGQWHRQSLEFSSNKVGAEGWLNRPPVELFLHLPGKGNVVDVDNLRLLDPDGQDVLCNGDFSHGGDCWFFKTHSHLPWHIKNVWVHVLFEQGWVGLLLFTTLTGLALYRLAKAGWSGHRLAWTWLASLAGLLTVGMFDSLLDAPRLATLLLAWIFIGAAHDWAQRGRSLRRRGPRRSHGYGPGRSAEAEPSAAS